MSFLGDDFEIKLTVQGPAGWRCESTSDTGPFLTQTLDSGVQVRGSRVIGGGLAYSSDDDCYLLSADGVVPNGRQALSSSSVVIDSFTIPFAYLAGGVHRTGAFTVTAKCLCVPIVSGASCPGSMPVEARTSSRVDDESAVRIGKPPARLRGDRADVPGRRSLHARDRGERRLRLLI